MRGPIKRAALSGALSSALLVLGLPDTPVVQAASAAARAAETAALEVASDPAGAAVYVDGTIHGTTPLALRTLSPGAHRVRLVKEGFLDNSRIVRLEAGRVESLQVKLTRTRPTGDPAPQVDPQAAPEKKGSKKKWVLIGVGAAAIGTTAYVIATKNDPPVAGTIGISPSGAGMVGLTTYTFTSLGSSDPDGDSLTYSWNFGDGASRTGQSTTHLYSSAGSFSVSLTISDGKKSVMAPSVTVTVNRSLTGTWSGTISGGFPGTQTVNFAQSTGTLGGTVTFEGVGGVIPTASLTGRIESTTFVCPCNVTFTVTAPGFVPFVFTGQVDGSIGRLTGSLSGSGLDGRTWTLTR